MASADEQKIATLFQDLQKAAESGDDDTALEACNAILKVSPDDRVALHCKVVTLIRLGSYNDAISIIARKFKNDSEVDLTFERIYCYYRTNQLQPAFDLLNQVKEKRNDPAFKYLEAQLVKRKKNQAVSRARCLSLALPLLTPSCFCLAALCG